MTTVKSAHAVAAPHTDCIAARLAFDLRCPHCGREVQARDVEIGRGDMSAICCECRHELMIFKWVKR